MKVAIIVLCLVVVLFAAVMLATDRSNSDPHRDNKNLAKKPAPSWVKSLGSLFGSGAPKLKLKGSPFIVNPSLGPITVPRSTDDFRTATFYLRSGTQVTIEYKDNTPGAGDLGLDDQSFALPRDTSGGSDDPHRGTITALKAGGTLKMTCSGVPCQVVLE